MYKTGNSEAPPKYYDDVFKRGAYVGGAIKDSLYQNALNLYIKRRNGDKRTLDIGCGPGRFGQMAYDQYGEIIDGVDFSEEAILQAQKRCPESKFWCKNLWDCKGLIQSGEYGNFVLTEILEHISEDIYLLEMIPKDSIVLITVPAFGDESHVRFFESLEDVVNSFRQVLYFLDVSEIQYPWTTWGLTARRK